MKGGKSADVRDPAAREHLEGGLHGLALHRRADIGGRRRGGGGSRRPCFWLLSTKGKPPLGLHVTFDGELRGIPEEEGAFDFYISVFDGEKYETKPVRLTINPKREGFGVEAGRGEL